MPPAVSIVVPVYNAARYLPAFLASVRAQTFTDFECVCVDDGSTDASPALLRAAADGDPRFRVLSPGHGGCMAARNAGLDAVRGDYVHICDCDDLLYPHTLACLHDWALRSAADAVSGALVWIPADAAAADVPPPAGDWRAARAVRSSDPARLFFSGRLRSPFGLPSIPLKLFRRDAIRGLRYFGANPLAEDGRFWLRALDGHVRSCVWFDFPVYLARSAPGSMSRAAAAADYILGLADGYREGQEWVVRESSYSPTLRRLIARWMTHGLLDAFKRLRAAPPSPADACRLLDGLARAAAVGVYVPATLPLHQRYRAWRARRALQRLAAVPCR